MKFHWKDDDQKYIKLGLTAFAVVVLSILANQVLHQLPILTVGVRKLLDCLSPILYGCLFAYLLTPLLNIIEKQLYKLNNRFFKKDSVHSKRIIRGVCVVITWGLTLAVISVLIKMVIPELISSVNGIISNMPNYVNKLTAWVGALLKDNPDISNKLIAQIRTLFGDLNTLISSLSDIIPNMSQISVFIGNVSSGVFSAVSQIFNLVVGIIVSIYIMSAKERFISQSKKLLYSIFPAGNGNRIVRIVRMAHVKFGGFFVGKILDSIVIGILCFILLSIFKIPFSVLISFVVGLTNIIPFFGPIIGAIPSSIILLLANPIKCLYFIIIIIVLQQLDGNVIGPKIIGSSTGLSSFWVMFAILVFGGMFGFWGLLCGVPLFAVIYDLVSELINHRLKNKSLPTDTFDYRTLDYIDDKSSKLVHFKEEDNKDVSENK